MWLTPPPPPKKKKNYISIVFNFSWDFQVSQEQLKQFLCKNGGEGRGVNKMCYANGEKSEL